MRVYLKSNSYQNKGVKIIENLCQQNKIELIESDNTINKLAKKIIVLLLQSLRNIRWI